MTPAQTVSPARQTAIEGNQTMALYNSHPEDATPASETSVTEKLGWAVQTLHDPRIRPNERDCLLLYAGEILVDYLVQQQMPRAIR